MSLPTSGTLLPAAGGMIHAMHGGGDGSAMQTAGTLLPAAGGMIHAMHGGSGSLLPIAGGTIHAMSGGDGGFMQTDISKTLLPTVNGASHPIHARSGGFRGGQRTITHLGESYTLQTPPEERTKAKGPYDEKSDEYKILHSLGLEDLHKLDRGDMSGTKQEYDVLKAIYDGKCNLNSSLGSLANCEPIRRIIHTLALELKQSIAFSMNIFNEADRAAANAKRALENGTKDSLAKALNEKEEPTEAKVLREQEEDTNAARVLREQEEAAQAALKAALEESKREESLKQGEIDSTRAKNGISKQLSDEDAVLSDENQAHIAIAAMLPNMTSEGSTKDENPDDSKSNDPFQTASIAAIAAVHDPSSLPIPVATVEENKKMPALTEEDIARIAVAAMMGLKQPPQSKKVKPEEPPIDPATDPNGYIAQKKIKEAEALLELGEKQDKLQSLRISLEEADKLDRVIPEYPVVPYEHSSNINSLQHFNEVQYRNATLSIIDSIKTMIQETEQSITQLEEKVEQTKKDREKAEQDYQHDAEVVKQTLTEWMKQQFEHLEQNVQKAREEEDSAVFQVDRVENDISFNNLSSIIEQSQKDLTTSWKPAVYTKWRDARKIIREYLNRAGLHRLYKDTYLEKYNASAKVFILESKHRRLGDISTGWLLNVEIPELKIHDNPFKNALQQDLKSKIEKIEQQLRENPAAVDPAAVIHVVKEADHALNSVEAVQGISPSKNVVEPKIRYQERIGEIGTIIDENDPSTFQPNAYNLLTKTLNRSITSERGAIDLLFDSDETNPYHSFFRSKNSVCARTWMTTYYNDPIKLPHPDFQFIKDYHRTRNWTIHFPTDMLTEEDRKHVVDDHISDNFDSKTMLYEKWIQPVLKEELTKDERAMFICFHQGMENAVPFGYSGDILYAFDNRGGASEKNGYISFDKHTLTLNKSTFSYQFTKLLYKNDAFARQASPDPENYVLEPVLFSGIIHIDRINYKKPNDTSFVQFELFDFHNPFLDALNMQQLKSMVLTTNEYLQKPFYSKMKRVAINDTSPFNNINTANREYNRQNETFYHKHLLSSFIDFMSRNPIKSKEVLDAIKNPMSVIQDSMDNMLDHHLLSTALGDIKDALHTGLLFIHNHFEKMIIQAHPITEPLWDKLVDNVYFDKGDPDIRLDQIEPENSLFKLQEQYKKMVISLSKERDATRMRYDDVMSMDTLKQIMEKIGQFHLADRSTIFKTLSEWYDKRNIAKNYESRKSFHEKLLHASKERFDIECQYMDATMSYQELVQLYMILTQKRDVIGDSSKPSMNESPPPSPLPSPPPSPRSSSSQTLLDMGSLLEKLEALHHDPSNADLQPAAKAAEEIVVELDEDAAELARLEEELRKAEAEVERTKALSKEAKERAKNTRERAAAELEHSQSDEPEQSSPAAIDLLSDESLVEAPAEEPSLKIPSESRPIAANAVVNPNANRSANRAAAIAKLEAELAAQRAALKAEGVKVVNGSVRNKAKEFNKMGFLGKHPKYFERKALNNALAVHATQATQAEATQATQEEPEIQSTQSNAIPEVQPSGIKSFNQQYQNALINAKRNFNQQQSNQEGINALIQSEMDHQGITTPRSISEESRPAAASVSENTSASTNINSSVNVMPIQTVPNKPKLPGLKHYTEQAGVKPYVAPVEPPVPAPASKSIAPAPIAQTAPFEISKKLIKQQEAYQKQLNNDPAVQRARERIKAAKKAEENEKKRQQNNMERQRTEALAARKASQAKQAPQSTSSKPFNPSSLQNAPPITKMNKAKAKKLEQIRLKVEMGQPLTKNEKAIYRSKGGTRKKTKQSRKKLQTRKRSSKRSSKRSTNKK